MHAALLGATGRTGTLVLDQLVLQGHRVRALVRAEGRVAPGEQVTTVVGDARDRDTLAVLVEGVDVVISALGPRAREEALHRDTARALVTAMTATGIGRFVGITGMNVQVPGDVRTPSSAVAAWLIRTLNRGAARDKRAEYELFAHSGLQWTLVRATRLVDGDETGRLEHDAHRSPRSSTVVRADLATFLVDVADRGWYTGEAPFVATARA